MTSQTSHTAHGTPSEQQAAQPEPVTPRAREDATAELGGEGGSYGEYTQSKRAEREWGGSASERQATWRLVPAALLALMLVAAAILAIVFWAMAA